VPALLRCARLRDVVRFCMVVAALGPAACSSAPTAPPAAVETSASITSATSSAPSTVPLLGPTTGAADAVPASGRARVVVLDPGHNGGNAGAPAAINRQVPDGRGGTKACNTTGTATDAGYAEHAFAFDVAQRVAQRLTARGVRVVLTRSDDDGVGPCVDERGRAGEAAGADAVVAIHADGAAPSGTGFHVAYSDPPLNAAQRGPARALAADLRDGLVAAGFTRSTYVGRDGLSSRTDLAGLNLATRPAALVECANMRNPDEAAVVSSAAGRDRYAAAIAEGILLFLGS
jgi:N-acetylmuramoyl-L-alanine amidase